MSSSRPPPWIIAILLVGFAVPSHTATQLAVNNVIRVKLMPEIVDASAPQNAPPPADVVTTNDGTLIFATVIYRHGARTPIDAYPTDPWSSVEHWPEGWGMLTNLGKRQHFVLGQWLRRRYLGTVLETYYNGSDIYVQSTDRDRTLQSATINSAALFPPNAAVGHISNSSANAAAWLSDPLWMPVPVHTIPSELDTVLLPDRKCDLYDKLYEEVKQTFVRPLLRQKHRELVEYLENHSGLQFGDDLFGPCALWDTLLIESERNLELPAWTRSVWPGSEFQLLSDMSFGIETQTPALARLKFGRLIGEILDRFRVKADGKLKPDRRMWVYSGHDVTLTGVLNVLGMYPVAFGPPYASALLLELWRIDGRPYVKILYRRGWNGTEDVNDTHDAVGLEVPNCGMLCPLERMFELYEHVVPRGSFEEECAVRIDVPSNGARTNGCFGSGWVCAIVLIGLVAATLYSF